MGNWLNRATAVPRAVPVMARENAARQTTGFAPVALGFASEIIRVRGSVCNFKN
jgi:hypothetical protein